MQPLVPLVALPADHEPAVGYLDVPLPPEDEEAYEEAYHVLSDDEHREQQLANTKLGNYFKAMIFNNNISIGAPQMVHALAVTFADGKGQQEIMVSSTALEFLVFAMMSLRKQESNTQKIKIWSSASNTTLFTYGFLCQIVALFAPRLDMRNPANDILIFMVLASSLGMGWLTHERDIAEIDFTPRQKETAPWRNGSILLDNYIYLVSMFSTCMQFSHLYQSQKGDSEPNNLYTIIPLVLAVFSLLMTCLTRKCGFGRSHSLGEIIGTGSNILRNANLCFQSTKAGSLGSVAMSIPVIGLEALKYGMGIGIFTKQADKCLVKFERKNRDVGQEPSGP
jgi:hypothetical protein